MARTEEGVSLSEGRFVNKSCSIFKISSVLIINSSFLKKKYKKKGHPVVN